MQANMRAITKVWKDTEGNLYGKSDFDGKSFNVYNLRTDTIAGYDFRNVVEGRELIRQYLPMEDKDAS